VGSEMCIRDSTWGDTVNNSITSLLDSAIAGTTTLSSDADVTLTTTTGASNTSRQAILLWTAGGTVTRNITAPAQSKIYTVINKSSSTQSIVLRGVGPTTGVTIVKGESAVCAWNGSDFIKISNTSGAGVFTTVTASSLTSGRVTYATTAGLLTDSANLLYSGTDLTVYGLTVGRGAGAVATNTAVGASALAGSNTGINNTAVGSSALALNTSGNRNAAVGSGALGSNTTGVENTAVGHDVASGNTTGSYNVAFGRSAMSSNSTGSNNSAIGFAALNSNTTASNNTAVGYQSIYTNTTGAELTAIGNQALQKNTTANWNIAVGSYALRETTTGSSNTAIGYSALQLNTTASNNTAVGYQAGYTNVSGLRNTYIGDSAGSAATTSSNTFIGQNSGVLMTSGANNTILGRFSGNTGGLDIRTASNYIVLSDGDGNPRGIFDNSGNLLVGATSTLGSTAGILVANSGANVQAITTNSTSSSAYYIGRFYSGGTEKGYIYFDGTNVSYTNLSDYRLKENVQPMQNALDKVAQLNPVTYNWKSNGKAGQGFVAHELQAVVPDCVTGDKDAVDEDGNPKYQGIDTSFLVATLTAAIQEQQALITQLTARITALESA
jgi:hypothetical protein